MDYKIIVAGIAVLAVVAFFYPKPAGSSCGFCPMYPYPQVTEYGCNGFKQEVIPKQPCMDCGTSFVCYGITTPDKTCYSYNYTGQTRQKIQVPCIN